jgi:hypothetical protein
MIFYKATIKARITGFRMAHIIGKDLLGGPIPVLQRLTPELERDCGNAYDLIVLPGKGPQRATFAPQ